MDEPIMTPTILTRDQVARQLAVPLAMLRRYESFGLVSPVHEGDLEGYGPAEIRRVWTIVSCQRDLGMNLAGVEAVLKLRDHMADVHRQLERLAVRLRQALDAADKDASQHDA
jgi:MerR family transcriptional regulator/heat shock protein HspR